MKMSTVNGHMIITYYMIIINKDPGTVHDTFDYFKLTYRSTNKKIMLQKKRKRRRKIVERNPGISLAPIFKTCTNSIRVELLDLVNSRRHESCSTEL